MPWTWLRGDGSDPGGFIGRGQRQLLRNCEDGKEENGDAGRERRAGARQPPHHRGDLQDGQLRVGWIPGGSVEESCDSWWTTSEKMDHAVSSTLRDELESRQMLEQ
jgi:hypothetical protein